MKIAHALGVVLAAALLPATAAAQSTPDNPGTTTTTTTTTTNPSPTTNTAPVPNTTPPSQPIPAAPTTTDPMPAPPPSVPATTDTTVTTTPPPVVVVQPSANTTPTYQPETEEEYDTINAPVFTTGAVLFGGSYAASAIVSGESDHPGANRLWVPVVGPWLALNDWGSCPIDQPRCDTNTTDKVLLIADGVVQAAGVLTMVDGLLMPSHHKVIRRTADTKVHVAPTGNGLLVFGHF